MLSTLISNSYFAFTAKNRFISTCDFTGLITRQQNVGFTRVSFHTVVVKQIFKIYT